MLVALLPMPYGYYQLLRLVATIAGLWIAHDYWKRSENAAAALFLLVALLFNPVFRVHLDREHWMISNAIAAGIFAAAGLRKLRED